MYITHVDHVMKHIFYIAIFCAFLSASSVAWARDQIDLVLIDTRDGPSLQETTKFITENVMDDISRITQISCQRIVINLETVHKDRGHIKIDFSFSPSEVVYKKIPEVEMPKILQIQCSSGQCIEVRDFLNEKKSRKTHDFSVGILVEVERVLRAMSHHQRLCGGASKVAF